MTTKETKETKDPFDTADYYSTDLDGDLPMFESAEDAVDDWRANLGPTEPHEGITVYGFRDHDGFCAVIGERYYSAAEVGGGSGASPYRSCAILFGTIRGEVT